MKEKYAYYLGQMKVIGRAEKEKLILGFGSAKEAVEASKEEIISIIGTEKGTAFFQEISESGSREQIMKMWAELEEKGIQYVSAESRMFPERFRGIPAEPYGIYVMGMLPDSAPSIAVVGSRRVSGYGARCARQLGYECGRRGIQLISGMARGVDSISQEAALEAGGYTAAVLAGGADVCYPGELKGLYKKIREEGCILSEQPPGTEPQGRFFASRNRLIAGLADVVVVVEAAEKSGSLITADMALAQGKEVYACPGRIGDAMSMGCNRLIAQGSGIIVSIEEFLDGLGSAYRNTVRLPMGSDRQKEEKIIMDPTEKKIYEMLDDYPRSVSVIAAECNGEPGKILAALTNMELMGLIYSAGSGYYARK